MVDLFKFRCYQCQKLIGAPPSRFGSVVKCPKCGVELVVPSPVDAESSPAASADDADAFRPDALGLQLDADLGLRPKAPTLPSAPDPVGPDPIAFLRQVAEAGPAFVPDPVEDEPEDSSVYPEAVAEPLVGRKPGRRPSSSIAPATRPRDVVLPRTAAVAWALFALLGLAFAFLTGLFVGHTLWK